MGLKDLDRGAPETADGTASHRLCLLGFSWTASSLIEEMARKRSDLLAEVLRRILARPEMHEIAFGESRAGPARA